MEKINLGDVELEILQIVWRLGEASVKDVQLEIQKNRSVAYTSVMTMMQLLSKKGYLSHRKQSRSYIYTANIDPETVKSGLLQRTLDYVFGGSVSNLVQHMVKQKQLDSKQLDEIKNMIESMDQNTDDQHG